MNPIRGSCSSFSFIFTIEPTNGCKSLIIMSIDYLLTKFDILRAKVTGMSIKDLIVKSCQQDTNLSREEILTAIENPKNMKFSVGEYDFSFIIDV